MSPGYDDYLEIQGGDFHGIAGLLKSISPKTPCIRLRLDRPDFLHVASRADFPSGLRDLKIVYEGDPGAGFSPLLAPGAPLPAPVGEEEFKRVVERFASKVSGVAFLLYWTFGPGHVMTYTRREGWVFTPDG